MSLFRKEVFENKKNQGLNGEIILPNMLTLQRFIVVIITLLVITIIFIYSTSYTDRKTIIGYLTPKKGLIHVYAPTSGKVDYLDIHEGQKILENEKLTSIVNNPTNGEIDYFQESKINLATQLSIIEQQIYLVQEEQKNSTDELNSEITLQQHLYHNVQTQIFNQQQKILLAEETYNSYLSLQDLGAISQLSIRQAHSQLINVRSEMNILLSNKSSISNTISTSKNDLKKVQLRKNEKLNQLLLQRNSVKQKKLEINKVSKTAVKASMNGTVTAININLNETVKKSQKLLTIIPDGDLKAHLLVPPQSIGFIKVGNSVSIRFDSYSYQKYGQGTGNISNISKTPVYPKDLAGSTAISHIDNQAYYLVDVLLDKQYISTNNTKQLLESGMTITADIKLEKRRLYEWIIEPLISLKKKGES